MHHPEQPRFSIALCTYNGSRFIAQQLDSLLAQTLSPFEIIICDDASTDDTFDILQSYADRHPELIRLYQNEQNLGFIRNFERAISLCEGDFIALCDQDDVWLSTKLEQMGKAFAENPDCGLVFSDAYVVDEDLTAKGYTVYDKYQKPNLDSAKTIENFVVRLRLLGCSLAFRTKLRPLILPVSSEEWGHDHWIAFTLACVSRLYMIETPLFLYRRHTANSGNSKFWNSSYFWRFTRKFSLHSLDNLCKYYRKLEDMYLHLSNLQSQIDDPDSTLLRHTMAVIKRRLDFEKMRIDVCHQPRIRRLRLLLRPSVLSQYARCDVGRFAVGKDLLRY